MRFEVNDEYEVQIGHLDPTLDWGRGTGITVRWPVLKT